MTNVAYETVFPGRHQIGTVRGSGLEYPGGIIGIRNEWTRNRYGADFEGLHEGLSIRDIEADTSVFQAVWNEERLEVALFKAGNWELRLSPA